MTKQFLDLPCGATLPKGLAKAAMSKGLDDLAGFPAPQLERFYSPWSDGGEGIGVIDLATPSVADAAQASGQGR